MKILKKKIIVAMPPHRSLRDHTGQAVEVAKDERVLVAMSGGVDSSVAAKILTDQGHEVVGVFLHFWKEENCKINAGFENKCCSTKALEDARRICQQIGIPLYTLNFTRPFKKLVVDNFLEEYKKGNTPNPCVVCNKYIKLGLLLDYAKKLGFAYVASGHYARLRREIQNPKSKIVKFKQQIIYKLYKARDKNKDQSYCLYNFNQRQLAQLLFPLGNYSKKQVRQLAKKNNLVTADKKESQEICFIPEKSHNDFLKRHLKLKPGPIKLITTPTPPYKGGEYLPFSSPYKGEVPKAEGYLNPRGGVIGRHHGLPLYTIGQRKGVAIGGTGPYYVINKDKKTNTLYVVNNNNNNYLYKNNLIAHKVNWLSGKIPKMPLSCQAVIRYQHPAVKCEITPLPNNNILVKLSHPQRAITPGQSVVFYHGDKMLGGGIIK